MTRLTRREAMMMAIGSMATLYFSSTKEQVTGKCEDYACYYFATPDLTVFVPTVGDEYQVFLADGTVLDFIKGQACCFTSRNKLSIEVEVGTDNDLKSLKHYEVAT